MSGTSYNFKDNLTIDNNKYLKWLDVTGTSRNNIIVLDGSNNVLLNSATSSVFINSSNSSSNTYFNVSNSGGAYVGSRLGVGFSSSSLSGTLTLVKNGWIGTNSTTGANNGYIGLAGSNTLTNTTGSRILLWGNDNTSGNAGQINLFAGNVGSGSIGLYTGPDLLRFQMMTSGTAQFTPNGSTPRCTISDSTTTFTNTLVLTNTAQTYSATTGALQIAGGVGVAGNFYVSGTLSISSATGNINFDSSQDSVSYTTGAIFLTGGLGISTSTPASSVTSGGALSIAGGAAIGQNMYVGGNVVVLSSTAAASSQTGSLVLYGGMGLNDSIWCRSDNVSQIRLAPKSDGSQTSISFFSSNGFSTSGSTCWAVGQGVGGVGAGNFGIWNYGPSAFFCALTSGNIGINNLVPQYTLDVVGTMRVSAGSVLGGTSNTIGNVIFTTGGSVGIGTMAPSKLLSLGTVNNTQKFALYDDGTGNNFYGFGASNNVLHIHAGASNGANGQVVVNTGGSVGIGTTAPSYTLDVSGNCRVFQGTNSVAMTTSSNAGANGPRLVLGTPTAPNSYLEIGTFSQQNRIDSKTNPLNIYNSNGSLIYCTTAGNIGINNTSPAFTLDVWGTARFTTSVTTPNLYSTNVVASTVTASTLLLTNLSATNASIGTLNANTGVTAGLVLVTSGGLSASFNSNTVGNIFTTGGNVGINTTSPQQQLEISPVNWSGNVNGGIRLSTIWPQGQTGYLFTNLNLKSNPGGTFRFGLDVNGNGSGGNTIEAMSVDVYGGRIGINNTSPAYTLDVSGGARVTTGITTGVVLATTSVSTGALYVTNGTITNVIYAAATSGTLNVSTGITTGMILVTGGGLSASFSSNTVGSIFTNGANVGIGTTAPQTALDISGGLNVSSSVTIGSTLMPGADSTINIGTSTSRLNSLFVRFINSGANSLNLNGVVTVTGSAMSCIGPVSFSNTTNAIGVGTGGSLTVAGGASFAKDVYIGGTMTSSSDERLKENIRPLKERDNSNLLEAIESIRTVRFNYKDDPDKMENIGFIAQDFAATFPELVRKPEGGFYTMDYPKVTVLLLQCIKELKAELQDLRSNVTQTSKHCS